MFQNKTNDAYLDSFHKVHKPYTELVPWNKADKNEFQNVVDMEIPDLYRHPNVFSNFHPHKSYILSLFSYYSAGIMPPHQEKTSHILHSRPVLYYNHKHGLYFYHIQPFSIHQVSFGRCL